MVSCMSLNWHGLKIWLVLIWCDGEASHIQIFQRGNHTKPLTRGQSAHPHTTKELVWYISKFPMAWNFTTFYLQYLMFKLQAWSQLWLPPLCQSLGTLFSLPSEFECLWWGPQVILTSGSCKRASSLVCPEMVCIYGQYKVTTSIFPLWKNTLISPLGMSL